MSELWKFVRISSQERQAAASGTMEDVIITDGIPTESRAATGKQLSSPRSQRCRLAAERQWVKALLQTCGRKIHPFYLRRWLVKYEDDCRSIQRCGGNC